jgi:hypothetical protein
VHDTTPSFFTHAHKVWTGSEEDEALVNFIRDPTSVGKICPPRPVSPHAFHPFLSNSVQRTKRMTVAVDHRVSGLLQSLSASFGANNVSQHSPIQRAHVSQRQSSSDASHLQLSARSLATSSSGAGHLQLSARSLATPRKDTLWETPESLHSVEKVEERMVAFDAGASILDLSIDLSATGAGEGKGQRNDSILPVGEENDSQLTHKDEFLRVDASGPQHIDMPIHLEIASNENKVHTRRASAPDDSLLEDSNIQRIVREIPVICSGRVKVFVFSVSLLAWRGGSQCVRECFSAGQFLECGHGERERNGFE